MVMCDWRPAVKHTRVCSFMCLCVCVSLKPPGHREPPDEWRCGPVVRSIRGGSVSEEQVRSAELEIPLRLSRRRAREWSVHTQRRWLTRGKKAGRHSGLPLTPSHFCSYEVLLPLCQAWLSWNSSRLKSHEPESDR